MARSGTWQVRLTPCRPVPASWFPPVCDKDVLCLASGGGQQGPLLAAAGARVTVFDNSPRQLAQDQSVSDREGLSVELIRGDMRDLSPLGDASFDLVVLPCANCFVEDLGALWSECARVLRAGGLLMSGFANPLIFCFERRKERNGVLELHYSVPYSDVESLTAEERAEYLEHDEPLCFGHSLEAQIAGQLDAGFVITGFYEDYHEADDVTVAYFHAFIATRAVRIGD
ncbi:MAG: class I SAM-dependent methyltransferase [Acidimicrobiales bacterium]